MYDKYGSAFRNDGTRRTRRWWVPIILYIYYAHIFTANVGVDGVLIVAGSKLVLTHPGLLNIKLLPIPLDYSWLDGG